MKLDDRGRRIVSAFAMSALLVQLVLVVLLSFFEKQALQMFAGLMPTSDEGVQNISRDAQIMAVVAPGLALTLVESRWRIAGIMLAILVLAATTAALAVREVFAGLLALAAAAAAIGVVAVFRRSGFRIIAGIIAMVVLAAPVIFGFLSRNGDAASANDTISYRMAIWRRVTDVIAEHPVWGSGVGVLRTIREQIPEGDFKGQFLIPNHAHNMTLQLWAETGVIGAALLAGAILLAGWRMPAPAQLGRTGWRAAGLAAALFANACVSFDLWNAGWWGMAGFLAVLIVAQARPAELEASPAQ
jgi:O-antigen ligase